MSHRGDDFKLYGYEYEIHFSMYDEEKSLELKLFNSWELEEVEAFTEEFFQKMRPNYYEDWDGRRRVKPE